MHVHSFPTVCWPVASSTSKIVPDGSFTIEFRYPFASQSGVDAASIQYIPTPCRPSWFRFGNGYVRPRVSTWDSLPQLVPTLFIAYDLTPNHAGLPTQTHFGPLSAGHNSTFGEIETSMTPITRSASAALPPK